MTLRAWRLALLVGLGGCDPWTASTEDGFEVLRTSLATGADGKVLAHVDVADHDKLLITAVGVDGRLGYLGSISDPDRVSVYRASDWWQASRDLTNAGFAAPVVVANWPISAQQAPLRPGRWTFDLRGQQARTDLDVTVILARDGDLTHGTLDVEVVYAADLDQDPGLRAGVQAALPIWSDAIYAAAGVDLTFSERTWDGSSALASPGYGDAAAYADAVAGKSLGRVEVLVIRKVTDVSHVLGVAGGIPGPLVETDRSVVTVAAVEAAGLDLVFNAAETRLLGETLAHEVGHYLGLFHPVELPTSGVTAARWDALDDTPECSAFGAHGDCVAALGANLMFPSPVCSGATCDPQETLTADQQGVLQRATAVR